MAERFSIYLLSHNISSYSVQPMIAHKYAYGSIFDCKFLFMRVNNRYGIVYWDNLFERFYVAIKLVYKS